MIVVTRLYFSSKKSQLLTELKNANIKYIYDQLEELKLYELKNVLGQNGDCGDQGEADIMLFAGPVKYSSIS